jgi:hypothetical protein
MFNEAIKFQKEGPKTQELHILNPVSVQTLSDDSSKLGIPNMLQDAWNEEGTDKLTTSRI